MQIYKNKSRAHGARGKSDLDLCAIIPYFTDQDADFNWHTQEIKPYEFNVIGDAMDLLIAWKAPSCDGVGQEVLRRHHQPRHRCTLF